jgi:hypothetical protein
VVDGQAANDWTGSPGAVLRQARRRQYKCRQRLDKIATKWDAYNMKSNDGKAMILGDTVEFGPQIDVPLLAFFDKFYAIERTK